jgi:hypothetical protein
MTIESLPFNLISYGHFSDFKGSEKNSRNFVKRINDKSFEWHISQDKADWFQELVDVLATSATPGHQYLEGDFSNIDVMVSCGEHPEDMK